MPAEFLLTHHACVCACSQSFFRNFTTLVLYGVLGTFSTSALIATGAPLGQMSHMAVACYANASQTGRPAQAMLSTPLGGCGHPRAFPQAATASCRAWGWTATW